MAMSVFDGHIGFDSHDGLTRFFAPRQAGKVLIFQETFLVADTRVEVVLGIPFLTLSIAFADEELVWKTYTAAEALSTTKWVELFSAKEFAAAALGADDEAFVARSRRPRMFILLAKQNCLTQRQSPRYDYTNVFPLDFAAVLPEHTGINDHPIDLVDDLPSHPLAFRTLSIRKMDGSL